jgi:putative restriction endonuclease
VKAFQKRWVMRNNNWTREELIIAFNLYCKIPFSKAVKTNPEVIQVAELIGRTPSAVAFKLGNFGSFDEELKKRGIGGLPNTSKLDKVIWDEFNENWEELAYESESLIAKLNAINVEQTADLELLDIPAGKERNRLVKQRINQNFFRKAVLASYNSRCCITKLQVPELLVASHIVPWSVDEKNRLNPRNGLCLNPIHDKAFDKGLITITTDYKVKVSNYLYEFSQDPPYDNFFFKYDNQPISLPNKFLPEKKFLEFHHSTIFKK